MLVIRLQRVGRRHQPSYRLVVSERRSKLGGPPVEDLGSYNPFSKTAAFKQERINHWIGIGAKPTVTVHNLLIKQGFVGGPKIKISIPKAEAKPEILKDKAPAEEETLPAGRQTAETETEVAPEVPAEQSTA